MALVRSHPATSLPAFAGLGAAALGVIAAGLLLQFGAEQALAILLLPVIAYAALHSVWVTYAALIGVICLAPFATLPGGGPVTPTLLEVALLATLGLHAAVLLLDRRQMLRTGGPQALWVLLVGTTGFAFVLGLGRGYTRETAHTYLAFVLALTAFWITLQLVNDAADGARVVQLLLGGIALAAGLALALYAGGAAFTERVLLRLTPYGYPGSRIVRYIEDDPSRPMRAVGTSVDPNSFGGLLMIGFVLATAVLFARRRLGPIWLGTGAFGLTCAALLLTYSRGAWVGAFCGAAVIVAFRRPRWLLPLGLAGALALTLGLGRAFVERLWLGFTLQDPATRLRIDEYRNAWAIIQRHPWFGVGFGDAPTIDLQTGVSSMYLTIAERAGLLGLAAFLVVIGVVVWRSAPILKAPGLMGEVALAAFAALSSALVAGLVDHYFFNPRFAHMSVLFWTIVGLLVALQGVAHVSRETVQEATSAVRSG